MTWRDRGEPTHESYCGCALPAGCWGDGGWHHEVYTQAKLQELAQAEAARQAGKVWALRAGLSLTESPQPTLGDAGERQQIAKDWLAAHAALLGMAYAYERCPSYRAAMQKRLDRLKAKKRTGREAD